MTEDIISEITSISTTPAPHTQHGYSAKITLGETWDTIDGHPHTLLRGFVAEVPDCKLELISANLSEGAMVHIRGRRTSANEIRVDDLHLIDLVNVDSDGCVQSYRPVGIIAGSK